MSAQIESGFEIDSQILPPSGTKTTQMIDQLSQRAVQRAKLIQAAKQLGNKTIYRLPDYRDMQKVEAMMIYEHRVI
jgi:hypothetical protein